MSLKLKWVLGMENTYDIFPKVKIQILGTPGQISGYTCQISGNTGQISGNPVRISGILAKFQAF